MLSRSQEATRPREKGASLAHALPGGAAVAVFLWWAHASGGYFPHVWYAGGLFLLSLLVVAIFGWPGDLFAKLPYATTLALVAFAAFTAWSYLSIGWADVRGDAWDGANRTALYLVVFALFALWRWTAQSGLILLGAFAAGVSVLGAANLWAAVRADDVGSYYIVGRFTEPVGYVNGNAALFLLAFWPALFLASRREVSLFLRPFFLALSSVLVQLAVLPQSRGAGIAFLVVLVVYFGLVPRRTRSFVFLLPVAVAVAGAFPLLLDAGSAPGGSALAAGARSAAVVIAISSVLLFLVGLVLAVADRRLEIPSRVRVLAGRALAGVAAIFLVGCLVFAAGSPDLRRRAADAWEERHSGAAPTTGSRRLVSGLETNRLDFWRVALDEFREHPVRGIGAENFGVAYARERESGEETLYPHSFPLQVLVQTGLVGAALMTILLTAALVSALATVRRQSGVGRGVSAVGIVIFASWLVHGSIDWFWELPALAGPAFGFLAMAGAAGVPMPSASSRSTGMLRAVVAALAVGLGLSFAFPWLSARDTRYAASTWRIDPAAAEARLERARRLNPLADRPDLTAGSIARRTRDWDTMAAAYERALERNPHNWYAHLQLALARSQQGRREDALQTIEKAQLLNPSEPVLDLVSGWLRRNRPVNVAEISRIFLQRHNWVTR